MNNKQLDLRQGILLNTARQRLEEDYHKSNPTEDRKRLVAKWREHHPDATQEVSAYLKPLVKDEHYVKPTGNGSYPDELWFNDTYHITVRRHINDVVFGTVQGMVQLGISSLDGTARHDWRDFQAIKNQIAGEECEGIELYPAESRLMDPSNYYSIWCFPGIKMIKLGKLIGRNVDKANEALAPQRAFPDELREVK